MKILFISSGKNNNIVSPIVKAQGESLRMTGVEIDYSTIIGHGILGYLKNLRSLKNKIYSYNPDIVHAHYSLSAITASIVCSKPMVVSLMGSDTVVPFIIKKYYISLPISNGMQLLLNLKV